MSTLNERIKSRRKELGLTQKELADMLSISDKTVSRWESNRQMPDALLIPEIAQHLQMTLNDLYGINDNMSQSNMVNTSNTEKYPKEKHWLILSYKLSVFLSVFVLLLGSIFRLIYRFNYINDSVGKAGTILLIIGIALLLSAEVSYSITYTDNKLYNPIYLQTDIVFTGISFLSIIPLLYITDVRYDVFISLALAIMYKILITLQKRKLKEHNIPTDSKITKLLTVLFLVFTLLLIAVVVFFRYFYYQYFYIGPVTISIGLQTMTNQSSTSSGFGLPCFTYALGLVAIIYLTLTIDYIKLYKQSKQLILH